MKQVMLSQGKFALVDDEDFELVSQYKWCVSHGYAWHPGKREKGKKRGGMFMHRFLTGAVKGEKIDHSDGNGFNNQRYNIRRCTHSQNMMNKAKQKNNTTGYKGVVMEYGKYPVAKICVNGKHITIKRCKTIEEAAIAYNEAAVKYHGEFARLNKV